MQEEEYEADAIIYESEPADEVTKLPASRTFRPEHPPLKAGDCTAENVTMLIRSDGFYKWDADVHSRDTNDTWRLKQVFKNDAGAVLFGIAVRSFRMSEAFPHIYHWTDQGTATEISENWDKISNKATLSFSC